LAEPGNEGNELPAGCPRDGAPAPMMAPAPASATDPFRPQAIRFGATVADLRAAVGGGCKEVAVRRIDPPFIVLRPHVKHQQLQMDCDGYLFEGKSRWAEFIFVDDSLEMVWIMTKAEDEKLLRDKMAAAYGKPQQQNEKFVAFVTARAALRLDVPEVLFYSERVAGQIEGWFGTPSTFR
jgi:hypothetical protein